jgi:hypothetical protein
MAEFNVNGKTYEVPEDLTFGEMCDAENYFGVDFNNVQKSGVRLSAALLWIAMTRKDKTVTVEDVRGLSSDVLASLAEDLGVDADPPPSEKPSESSEPQSSGSTNGSDDSANVPSPTGIPS